ncbi:MAG: sensor domain-containing diguanylate cyclase [Deltaproteobacteria bacterium]|nr:sensor domain-containing diguanylate cyclase [Deltaproteobacteria bacterium]
MTGSKEKTPRKLTTAKPAKPAEPVEPAYRHLHLATFNEIGKALTSSLDLKEILKVVMENISTLMQPKNWSLLLVDDDRDELRFEIIVGEGAEKLKDLRLKIGEGIAGWVAREKKPLLVPDVDKDPRFSRKGDEISNFKTQSIICVPLVTRGKCLGVIELINKVQHDNFSEDDLLLLTTLADYSAIAIENAMFFKKVEELTITDDLTKLYNSRFMHNRLEYEVERARRSEHQISLVFMDLDHFKEINDNFGHLCGSRVLKAAAKLIRDMIRSTDMACRYGGDEFLILMPETAKDNAILAAEKLRAALKKHIFLTEEGINAQLSGSFGVASFPDDASDKDDLIHKADNAMYAVKNSGRNGVSGA